MKRTGLLIVIVIVVALAAFVQESPWPAGVTPEMVAEGQEIFRKRGFCFTCHGQTGRGGSGANLTDADWLHSDGSYEGIVATILRGVPPGESSRGITSSMLPKGGTQLPEEDIRKLAAFVWSLSRRAELGLDSIGG